MENPRTSRQVSGLPISPATVEKRISISVLAPGWNSAAFVYLDTSEVVSNTPKAPAPFACGWRSGTFSRLKCAICSRKCTSCSTIGPSGPMVSELRSLGAGAPVLIVEPVARLLSWSAMTIPCVVKMVWMLLRRALKFCTLLREGMQRPQRHDAGRIDGAMALVVVALDVVQVHGGGDFRNRHHPGHEVAQGRVVHDPPQVALEVPVVDSVEAHQGGEQPDVGLGHALADQPLRPGQPGLQPVQRVEQGPHRILVGALGGRESGLVDPVVDLRIHPRVDPVDLGTQRLRIVVAWPCT